jgi:Holliday junction DNA helicase RuvA
VFNSLSGTVTLRRADLLRIETGGVEWEMEVSAHAARSLPERGRTARVLVFLYHREDIMRLYGFAEEAERDLFLDLIRVSGIGPKQAMRILSGVSSAHFARSVEAEDIEGLSGVPGVGKKTAQKIILALKGKLRLEGEAAESEAADASRDLAEGLVAMGYARNEVDRVLSALVAELDLSGLGSSDREERLFREAILRLGS